LPASAPPSAPIIIAIDGPAGAGKSTAARTLAQRLKLPFLDTGAIYRAVALQATEKGLALDDEPRVAEVAIGLPLRFVPDGAAGNRVYLGERDVSKDIRTPEMSQGASKVSALKAVRAALLGLQRRLATETGVVAEGRDVGTVVFPGATAKFFLTASVDERARRRQRDLEKAGAAAEARDLDVVRREIVERDARDAGRDVAPLKQADDAVLIDTSNLTLEEVVSKMENVVHDRAFPLTGRGGLP
jgi:cytidylate kinase